MKFITVNKKFLTQLVAKGVVCSFFLFSKVTIAQIPQIPAFLPRAEQVSVTQAMPIDGVWMINTIGKKVRIEGGRAVVIDGWMHLFVLDIQPGMVVIQNIMPTAAGKYGADDLPLMGKWKATVQSDRSLSVVVETAVGAMPYKMLPVQIDNQQWFDQEMQAAGLTVPSSAPVGTPSYQFTPSGEGVPPAIPGNTPAPAPGSEPEPNPEDCEMQQYNPRTDTTICLD